MRNESESPAPSLHAYSPRRSAMISLRLRGDRPEALGVEQAEQDR